MPCRLPHMLPLLQLQAEAVFQKSWEVLNFKLSSSIFWSTLHSPVSLFCKQCFCAQSYVSQLVPTFLLPFTLKSNVGFVQCCTVMRDVLNEECFSSGALSFVLHLDVHLGEIIAAYGRTTYAILFAIVFAETGLIVTPFLPGERYTIIWSYLLVGKHTSVAASQEAMVFRSSMCPKAQLSMIIKLSMWCCNCIDHYWQSSMFMVACLRLFMACLYEPHFDTVWQVTPSSLLLAHWQPLESWMS